MFSSIFALKPFQISKRICCFISLLFIFLLLFLLTGCDQKDPNFQGYIDARYVYVSSNVSGRLQKLLVYRGDPIIKKQLLFVLQGEPQESQLHQVRAELNQARDQLASQNAALDLAEITLVRRATLEEQQALDIQSVDEAKTTKEQAVAGKSSAISGIEAKRAALKQAEWYFSEKEIHAIKNAIVFDTYYLPGELVPQNTPVLSLLSKEDIYAIFYVNGLEINRLSLNQPVKIFRAGVEEPIEGRISYISPTAEYAPPVIYSNETNKKLVFRIEVTPTKPTYDLHPGAPIEIKL